LLIVMSYFKTVLCAVDFSDHSAQAVRWAAALADEASSVLHVVSVVDPLMPMAAAIAYDLESLTADMRADLRDFLTGIDAANPRLREVTLHLPIGHAGREILRTAESVRADVIVLGTRGLGAVRRLLLGSTTHRVMRDGGVPVLAVPLPDSADARPFTRGGAVVAAIDVERPCRNQIRTAAALAGDWGSSLVLVHALEPVQLPERWRHRVSDAQQQARRQSAEERLDAAAALVHDVDVETVVEAGDPQAVLATVANERSAQLLVIGLGDPARLASRPGTTAYRLVCGSSVAVLAVPEDAAAK
jgi:nucleotide-binding universal stress UspA family protein